MEVFQKARSYRYADTNLELIDEIDRGWRYFWKQRGFDEPPSLIDAEYGFGGSGFKFSNEKKSPKKSKQKKTKGLSGIQKDW